MISKGCSGGRSISLTNSATVADAPALTNGNDTVTGALGTIQDIDRLIDSSTTDSDVFNATLNVATAKPQVINVETLNINGEYIATGFDFANSVGVKTANLSTGITGGTATVTNAVSSRIAEVKAGSNVNTLVVNSDVSGTGSAVKVDTGSAATITVGATGANTGNDLFDITLGTAATSLTLEANGTGAQSSADAFTVKFVGNTLTTFNTDAGEIETLNLNSTGAANTVTLTNTSGDLLVATGTGKKAVVSGDKAFTLVADWDNLTGTTVENTNTAGFNIKTTSTVGGTTDLKAVAANVAEISVSQGAQDIKFNEGTTVKLSVDNLITTAKGYNVDNTAGTMTTGTLKVDLATGQTNLQTLAKVATLDMGVNTVDSTIGNLILNDSTSTVKLSGSKQLTLTLVNDLGTTDDTLITATTMTGKLILTDVSADKFVVVGGSGNDSLTVTSAKADTVVRGGDGADTIVGATLGSLLFGDAGNDNITAGTAASVIDGGAGNDILTGNAGVDTISGGDGDDVIDGAAGADTITGGAGADKFVVSNASTTVFDYVKDFVAGTDKLVFASTNTSAITKLTDLTALSAANQAAVDTAFGTSMVAAINSVMSNKGSGYTPNADNTWEAVTFKVGTDTYVFINKDATTDNTAGTGWLDATDFVVKLTGVTGTVAASDILVS